MVDMLTLTRSTSTPNRTPCDGVLKLRFRNPCNGYVMLHGAQAWRQVKTLVSFPLRARAVAMCVLIALMSLAMAGCSVIGTSDMDSRPPPYVLPASLSEAVQTKGINKAMHEELLVGSVHFQ
jgi:hypothetical protein